MLAETSPAFEAVEPLVLSTIEDIFWRLEEQCGGAFRVAVVFRLDGCLEAEFLAHALAQIQRRHPKLRAFVAQGTDGRRRFHFPPSAPRVPFEIKDYDESESPWREETRRLLQIRLPPDGPLAVITVLRNRSRNCSELLLTLAHAIADGRSAIMLIHELLSEYAAAEAHSSTPPVLPVLRPVSAERARSIGWKRRLRLLRRIARMQGEERRSRWTPLPEAPGTLPQTQWVHWVFSREETLRLVRRCRQEHSSLNGAMVAAVCCGLIDCLGVSAALFKCHFPFDLRGQLDGPRGTATSEDLGCFASMMNEFYEVQGQPEFWDVARRAHRDLSGFVSQGGPSFNYNLAMTFERLAALARMARRLFSGTAASGAAAPSKRATLLATNYGVLDMRDAYGSLRPRECTLMFKNDEAGPSLIMEALVLGQRLNIGLAAEGLEPAFWERFQGAVRTYFDTAANATRTAQESRGSALPPADAVAGQRMSVAPQE